MTDWKQRTEQEYRKILLDHKQNLTELVALRRYNFAVNFGIGVDRLYEFAGRQLILARYERIALRMDE